MLVALVVVAYAIRWNRFLSFGLLAVGFATGEPAALVAAVVVAALAFGYTLGKLGLPT